MKVKTFLTAGAAALALGGCGTDQHITDDPEEIDEQILGEADNSDPALTEALEDQIMIDPDLAEQSNEHAALSGEAVSGAPVPDTLHGVEDAREAIAEGRLLSTPAPTRGDADGRSAARGDTTLGAMAAREANVEACRGEVQYSMGWASTLPTPFRLYPNAELIEAAGYNNPNCRFRVASFRTAADRQRVMDWYYTRAIRTGYSAEHQIADGNHVLGGFRERDEGAFYIVFADRADGGTEVDIVANRGR